MEFEKLSNSSGPSRNPFVSTHIESNRQSRDAWARFANHRERIHDLLTTAATKRGGSLCVLGAGNCNDLDLNQLQSIFGEICLVDVDHSALQTGVDRQQPLETNAIRLIAPVDLTGVLEELNRGPNPDRMIRRMHTQRTLPGPFDVVLSAGLLTQIFQSIDDTNLAGEDKLRLILELRRQHLHLLLDATRDGGASILVTDAVSTATTPDFFELREDQLQQRFTDLIKTRNFFTGTNPVAIWKELTEPSKLSGLIGDLVYHSPWIWAIFSHQSYLTWGVTMRKRTTAIDRESG